MDGVEEYEATRAALADKAKDILTAHIRKIFESAPEIQALRWSQYTPYFNDGEECVFQVYDPEVRVSSEPAPVTVSVKAAIKCKGCERPNPAGSTTCLWCGAALGESPPYEGAGFGAGDGEDDGEEDAGDWLGKYDGNESVKTLMRGPLFAPWNDDALVDLFFDAFDDHVEVTCRRVNGEVVISTGAREHD